MLSPNHIAEPAFWRCVKSCVNLGLIYVLWLPLPSAYGVYLPSALSRPAAGGTLAAQRDTNMLLRTNQESVVFQGNPELYFPYDTP